MLPGDRLVCAFVRSIQVGDNFRQWPLHVTIVPWFRLPDESARIVASLTAALTSIPPFEASAASEVMLGPRRNRPALLLHEPSPFHDVEQRVRAYFHKKRAWLVDETTKVRRAYRPHVTAQKDDQLAVGEHFACDRVYLVAQMGGIKAVVGEIPFKL